ncbi:MAG: hypothetical protein O2826_12145, partial [Chloroflexi bacterium]|nr:hypothetical protein [Chloroflexota bacterium]
MYAYIDESGNTGAHLFDAAQPSFLNVAMSSHVDFDTVFRDRVFRIADSTPLNHLHGSELGLGGVESIARKIS